MFTIEQIALNSNLSTTSSGETLTSWTSSFFESDANDTLNQGRTRDTYDGITDNNGRSISELNSTLNSFTITQSESRSGSGTDMTTSSEGSRNNIQSAKTSITGDTGVDSYSFVSSRVSNAGITSVFGATTNSSDGGNTVINWTSNASTQTIFYISESANSTGSTTFSSFTNATFETDSAGAVASTTSSGSSSGSSATPFRSPYTFILQTTSNGTTSFSVAISTLTYTSQTTFTTGAATSDTVSTSFSNTYTRHVINGATTTATGIAQTTYSTTVDYSVGYYTNSTFIAGYNELIFTFPFTANEVITLGNASDGVQSLVISAAGTTQQISDTTQTPSTYTATEVSTYDTTITTTSNSSFSSLSDSPLGASRTTTQTVVSQITSTSTSTNAFSFYDTVSSLNDTFISQSVTTAQTFIQSSDGQLIFETINAIVSETVSVTSFFELGRSTSLSSSSLGTNAGTVTTTYSTTNAGQTVYFESFDSPDLLDPSRANRFVFREFISPDSVGNSVFYNPADSQIYDTAYINFPASIFGTSNTWGGSFSDLLFIPLFVARTVVPVVYPRTLSSNGVTASFSSDVGDAVTYTYSGGTGTAGWVFSNLKTRFYRAASVSPMTIGNFPYQGFTTHSVKQVGGDYVYESFFPIRSDILDDREKLLIEENTSTTNTISIPAGAGKDFSVSDYSYNSAYWESGFTPAFSVRKSNLAKLTEEGNLRIKTIPRFAGDYAEVQKL